MKPILAFALLAIGVAAHAQESFYASSERFGYTGTVTVYGSFADAQSGRNPLRSNIAFVQRDAAIYLVRNAPQFYATDFNSFLTNWYSDTSGGQSGAGNPNNQNLGFVQFYDAQGDNWQNQKAWWSKDMHTFTVTAKGRDAAYDPYYSRLWNAGSPAGSGESTKGTWVTYDYQFVASGINGAVKGLNGMVTFSGHAGAIGGYFRGIFRNESHSSPVSNGYYVVDLQLGAPTAFLSSPGVVLQPDEFGSKNVK
jgi:hypothetical protein